MITNLEDTNLYFQAALKQLLRKQWGLQTKLAKEVGVSQQTISKLVKGTLQGKEVTRRKIAAFLGYTYEDFLQLGHSLLTPKRTIPVAGEAVDRPPLKAASIMKQQIDFLLANGTEDEVKVLQFTLNNLYNLVAERIDTPKNR